MKVCYVNLDPFGSTGWITANLSKGVRDSGGSSLLVTRSGQNSEFAGTTYNVHKTDLSYKFSRSITKLFDGDGFRNSLKTRATIRTIDEFNPDILHIHNLHGSFINMKALLDHAFAKEVPVVWTLHDEWLMTGRCGCFFACDKWKTDGCLNCCHKNYYPSVVFSNSHSQLIKKTCYIKAHLNISFVSPSEWLAREFKSVYSGANVALIRNGIDTSVFKPSTSKRQDIQNMAAGRICLGGAAFDLSEGKGVSYFYRLSQMIPSNQFAVFVIGSDQTKRVGDNLFLVKRASRPSEMSDFYNNLDVFINPTQSDNFPTTNLESICCGTPVLSFDVGGATEMIQDGINGYAVQKNNLQDLIDKMYAILAKRLNKSEVSLSGQRYSLMNFVSSYISLYQEIINNFKLAGR